MSFHEVLFPVDISYGSKGGPTYNTKIIELVSGQEQRIPRWSAPQFRYDVAEKVKSVAAWATLASFYIARLGPANGFRFKDWTNFSSAADNRAAATNLDQVIVGTEDGVNQVFQLRKGYTSGGVTVWKNIYKPVAGSTLVAVNGTTAPHTVDTTTGLITITTPPTVGQVITAGFQFDMPVRFGNEMDQNFLFNYEDFDIGSIDTVPIIEIINPLASDEEFYYGGSASLTFSANISISALTGRVLELIPTSALTVYLPNATEYPGGGAHWYIYNNSAFSLAFKQGATTYFSIAGGSKATVVRGHNGTTPVWLAF